MKEQTMKKLITLIMTFLLCLGSVAPTFAADKKKGFDASAKHAIAVEATTGKILYEKDATTPTGIGSITNSYLPVPTVQPLPEPRKSEALRVSLPI